MLDLLLFAIENDDDRTLVTLVYERHSIALYQYALKVVNDSTVAMDITQETFLGFVRNLHNLRNQSIDSIYAYLFTSQKNSIKKYYNKKYRESKIISFDNMEEIPSDEDVNAIASSNEQYNKILLEIHKLSPIYSDVLILHLVNDLSLKKISKILDEPYATIKKRYSRGLKKITDVLKKEMSK